MSTMIQSIIDDAKLKVGDPGLHRVTPAKWLAFYNEAARTLATRLNLVRSIATFNIEAANEMYSMPDDSVQMTRLEINDTPSDPLVWRDLDEIFLDEFREAVTGQYPTSDRPDRYFADAGYFYLVGRPTTEILGGGRITYWGLPDDATAATESIPFANVVRDALALAMAVLANDDLEKPDIAAQMEERLERRLDELRPKLTDRSADRRSSIRPKSWRRGFGGMT